MSEIKLKSCPHCGNKNIWIEDIDISGTDRYYAICMSCGVRTNYGETPEIAASNWNMRAERTCRNVSEDAERCNFFKCSECGCLVEDGEHYEVYVGTDYGVNLPWSYCPHCGRKVVS